ncbi:hypothetical protein CXG81DRAFT_18142 [Caulochytrium protostelioides]|uniref:Mitochondrial import inner membrane translocase subunit Tim21 n=1 Tax=Caulochytrium protostelioides TaxID=1555241 RepID=A0A4P9X9Y7_9FUNG|nr:hypothetical protein CXG81DRAFT_18142 [Caulochytrium protostelioides]|eukprot:RKP02174.1 hypothetical protein CXG81DRAFT_18142 [Caulochytrium protostelioides]
MALRLLRPAAVCTRWAAAPRPVRSFATLRLTPSSVAPTIPRLAAPEQRMPRHPFATPSQRRSLSFTHLFDTRGLIWEDMSFGQKFLHSLRQTGYFGVVIVGVTIMGLALYSTSQQLLDDTEAMRLYHRALAQVESPAMRERLAPYLHGQYTGRPTLGNDRQRHLQHGVIHDAGRPMLYVRFYIEDAAGIVVPVVVQAYPAQSKHVAAATSAAAAPALPSLWSQVSLAGASAWFETQLTQLGVPERVLAAWRSSDAWASAMLTRVSDFLTQQTTPDPRSVASMVGATTLPIDWQIYTLSADVPVAQHHAAPAAGSGRGRSGSAGKPVLPGAVERVYLVDERPVVAPIRGGISGSQWRWGASWSSSR